MPTGKRNKPKRNKIHTKKHASKNSTFLRVSNTLIHIGLWSIATALFIVGMTLWPAIQLEIGYNAKKITAPKSLEIPQEPIDKEFGIIIPKINANAKIIPSVDPFNSVEYQNALTRGVAHAKGSAFPGEGRNTFLFSHSSVNFFEALRYNSVFYLLSKMERGDPIDIYYRNIRYTYNVAEVRTVAPSAVEYLFTVPKTETLTLMTCWPPGTTYKRLIVIAERL